MGSNPTLSASLRQGQSMNRKERRAARKRGQGRSELAGSATAAALFAQAVRHHQLGRLFEAEMQCRSALSQDPRHADSLHLLGVIAQQRGLYDEAAEHFGNVVGLRPNAAIAHQNLGGALAVAGRIDEAIAAFERAMALRLNDPAPHLPDAAQGHLNLGSLHHQRGRLEEAARHYEQALAVRPDYAEAHNNLGALLLAQGRLKAASAQFARALVLAPEAFGNFADVAATLFKVNLALAEATARAQAAWPRRLPLDELVGSGGFADDALLCCVLETTTVRDIALERLFTVLRAVVLDWAVSGSGEPEEPVLRFCCALARQCFINEYVFAGTLEERQQTDTLTRALNDALANATSIRPLQLVAVASYLPLQTLPNSKALLERSWPEAVAGLLTQQIREVEEERWYRDSIPRLTSIEDRTSALVREQYEENPYPRWILAPSLRPPVALDEYLAGRFPWAPFRPQRERVGAEILVAGCGTGEHAIGTARRYAGARVLAVDLSLSSLCYAVRKTRELGVANIDYAQADILQLAALDRSFDFIDASGVLHHLANPIEGWRCLLSLLRSGGLMRIGLYSELGRAEIVAARRFIAEEGFRPTADDIRRCRQELLDTPLRAVAKFNDFFSTSECRDMLFHVQEHCLTIPQIKEFLLAHRLTFIGFELGATVLQAYRARFPQDQSMTDLDRWQAFETERPGTFTGMYQFWCQKS
jgi:tetratricopeptide (TPR) repeat protein/SAM-dependent methyltransferase